MGQLLLLLVVALTVAAVVFGVAVLITGSDPGLVPAEPDSAAVPLPGTRPLQESDVSNVRFDTTGRGYRMAQVDQAMRRAAYDIGYKDELIGVLEAEVIALREGRTSDADVLRRAREAAIMPAAAAVGGAQANGAATQTREDVLDLGPVTAESVQSTPALNVAVDPAARAEADSHPRPVAADPVADAPAEAGSDYARGQRERP